MDGMDGDDDDDMLAWLLPLSELDEIKLIFFN